MKSHGIQEGVLKKYLLILLGQISRIVEKTGRSDFMVMESLEIKLPLPAKNYVLDDTTDEMRNALLLYPSIANQTISHGRAAELLGMHKIELIALYSRMGHVDMEGCKPYFESEDVKIGGYAFEELYYHLERASLGFDTSNVST